MKLMRATLGGLWRLTRATSIVGGLAVMVALFVGVVSQAVAAPSGTTTATAVLKGVSNTATTVTTLINSGTGAALGLQVKPNNPPLTVNPDAGTATNLSADKLDGKDSKDFLSTKWDNNTNDTYVVLGDLSYVSFARCDPGDVLLSGGFATASNRTFAVESAPYHAIDGDFWRAIFVGPDPPTSDVSGFGNAFALCTRAE